MMRKKLPEGCSADVGQGVIPELGARDRGWSEGEVLLHYSALSFFCSSMGSTNSRLQSNRNQYFKVLICSL